MTYVKKSPEEVSAARSRAGRLGNVALQRKGGSFGGRPKGVKNKTSCAIKMHNFQITQQDWSVFAKLAAFSDVSIVQFVHRVAETLRLQNPHLFTSVEVKMPTMHVAPPTDASASE